MVIHYQEEFDINEHHYSTFTYINEIINTIIHLEQVKTSPFNPLSYKERGSDLKAPFPF
jgi:hypothetical protein